MANAPSVAAEVNLQADGLGASGGLDAIPDDQILALEGLPDTLIRLLGVGLRERYDVRVVDVHRSHGASSAEKRAHFAVA